MKHVSFSHMLLGLAMVLFHPLAQAQNNFAFLDTNNVRARVNSGGLLFGDPDLQRASFEVPKNGGVSTIFASNFWIGGVSSDQQLKLAVGTFGQGEQDWFPGPLTADGTASTTAEVMSLYDRVWLANKSQIATHLAYIDAVQSGDLSTSFPNGYSIPSWFFDWPAHGDTQNGFALNLAPFVDVNLDGLYNPTDLDYPNFPGDQCAYFIINDKGGVHPSGSEPIGIEVHVMIYAFNATDGTALDNTVFVNYHVINRGTQTLSDTYCGIWTDTDLGTSYDDYLGCNVEHSFFYCYNGDALDEASSTSLGYGTNIPIQTVAIYGGPKRDDDLLDNGYTLSGPTSGTYAYDGVGTSDGIIDNEELGFSHFVSYNIGSNPVNGEPQIPSHFYNFMKGMWKNGSPMTYGGNGAGNGTGSTSTSASYMFPGTSDPYNYNTNGVQMDEWTETTTGNPSGDRRGMASMGPFTLEPQEEFSIDLAFTAVDTTGSGLNPLVAAAEAVDGLANYFQQNVFDVFYGFTNVVSVPNLATPKAKLAVAPNPAREELMLNLGDVHTLTISNLYGQQVMQLNSTSDIKRIDISALSSGIYILSAPLEQGVQVVRFVKE